MSYAIFRVQPIQKLKDLGQIGAHNKREKEAYKSNPDIDKSTSENNIDLVPLSKSYFNGYMELVSEYKKQHNKKQENERESRKKTFSQMLDSSNSVIADELFVQRYTGWFYIL